MKSKTATHVEKPEAYVFLGVTMEIHLSAAQTGGEFSLILATMPPGGDGGLHMHTREDEALHLLEGSLEVVIGDISFTLKPGESSFAPRGTPHRLKNTGHLPVRALLINTPGAFDEFVRKAGVPLSQGTAPFGVPDAEQIAQLLALATEFGVEVLAPPEPPMVS